MIRFLDHTRPSEACVVTVGSFDGVHLGHQSLVEAATREARKRRVACAALTFDQHPRVVLGGRQALQLMSLEDRSASLQSAGADDVAILQFDEHVAELSAEAFVKQVLIGHMQSLVVVLGHDHRFGKGRSGDCALMRAMGKQLGFSVVEVPAVTDTLGAVSSSRIRGALQTGRVEDAARMLGRPFFLKGVVVSGDGRGSEIGFPTANLDVDRLCMQLPARGVYAVWATVDGCSPRRAMLNIGVRPTFGGHEEHVEVHLLDTEADLYGREVRAEFAVRLRDECKFNGAEALVRQLNEDRLRCRAALR